MEGNQMKMREALMALVRVIDECASSSPLWWHNGAKGVEPLRKAKAALSAPARNCDLFACYSEAANYWHENVECADVNGCFDVWLFEPAAERKGEGDGVQSAS